MALFTFTMSYGGGFYTSQREAETVEDAIDRWITRNPCRRGISTEEWRGIARDIENAGEATRLLRTKNAWFLYACPAKKPALINIVKTAQDE